MPACRARRPELRARPPRALRAFCCLLMCVGMCPVVGGGGGGGGALLGASLVCARGLTDKQRALCHAAPAAVAALGTGLSMAYEECRTQLAGRRWNCSGVGDDGRLGHVLPRGTKEAAFTYAITSAGVTHALGAACARGDLPTCSCSSGRRRLASTSEQWEWGGCGSAAWGGRFARRFLDARELEHDARAAMNLHNNRAGRKLVKDMVRRECKCHGVSGSCAVRTCWRALPAFGAVGAALRERYGRARLVAPRGPAGDLREAPYTHPPTVVRQPQLLLRRSRAGGWGRAARRSELVYLSASPPYCEPDPAAAALGTHGRHCNRTSTGEDGCESLCCGRGYSTVQLTRAAKCRCRFHWCCSVSCHTCVSRTEVHVCN